MVFKAESAPRNKPAFMDWYRVQTQWKEEHGYNNPDVTTPELRNWMLEMMKSFPAMNGPYAKSGNEEDGGTADYNIGQEFIYATFSWDNMDKAYRLSKELAQKHKVGFFNVSADDGEVIFPNAAH